MIHLRVVSPSDLTEKIIALLAGDPGVLNLVVLAGRARNPDGDAIECDVLGGTANTVLSSLRRLRVDQRGSIVIEPVELPISGRTADVEAQRLGALANAPVWEAVEARIHADGTYPPRFYLFLIIAGIIGAVGILTNSQILIVAAMVLGPEYGAITSIALGLDRHSGKAVREGLSALTIGFLGAIVAAFAFALLVRVLGLEPTVFRLVRAQAGTACPSRFSPTTRGLLGQVATTSRERWSRSFSATLSRCNRNDSNESVSRRMWSGPVGRRIRDCFNDPGVKRG
jgi:hypothetical protein